MQNINCYQLYCLDIHEHAQTEYQAKLDKIKAMPLDESKKQHLISLVKKPAVLEKANSLLSLSSDESQDG